MTVIRRTLLRVTAWAVATALAVTMSWLGVHQVLAAGVSGDQRRAIPIASSTTGPRPSSASTTAREDVRGYQLTGGRVVLEITATSARLVSATPETGWRVQTWAAAGWLRVAFSRDSTTSSCFVTWNGHPPTVQTT
jgi:hypothetical protein